MTKFLQYIDILMPFTVFDLMLDSFRCLTNTIFKTISLNSPEEGSHHTPETFSSLETLKNWFNMG